MQNCVVDLQSLITPTLNLIPANIERLGRHLYSQHYCGVSGHQAHDGDSVTFFEERFDHAFFKSSDPRGGGRKDGIDIDRVQRVLWIGRLIQGSVYNSECLQVPNKRPDKPDTRLYIINSEMYVVWLEPLEVGGWVFSSAYKPMARQIKAYRKSGKKIWEYGWRIAP